jgi:hypothetical protein
MQQCTFCNAAASIKYALMSLDGGDPTALESWRRDTLPVCPECYSRLRIAGADGIASLTFERRWWLGHGTGSPARVLREHSYDA